MLFYKKAMNGDGMICRKAPYHGGNGNEKSGSGGRPGLIVCTFQQNIVEKSAISYNVRSIILQLFMLYVTFINWHDFWYLIRKNSTTLSWRFICG